MFKKNIKSIISTLFLVSVLCLPFFVFADGPSTSSNDGRPMSNNSSILDKLEGVGNKSGYSQANEKSLAGSLGLVVNILLSLLGIVFIILIIMGGFQWMTAGGNEEAVKKAKSRVTNAVIGLIIVVSAYAIWNFIERFFINRL